MTLASTAGIAWVEWLVAAPGTPLDGFRSSRIAAAPFSYQIPLPPYSTNFTLYTSVFDGVNTTVGTLKFVCRPLQTQMIGCRTGLNGEFGTAWTSTNFYGVTQSRHVLPYGADSIQLVWAGFKKNSAAAYKEVAITPAVWRIAPYTLTASGGTGYAAGDTVTGPASGTTSPGFINSWIARVLQVSAGAPTKLALIRPGLYVGASPPADGMAQSATSGGGSAATYNAQWDGGASAHHISITPAFATPILNGAGALELSSVGPPYGDMTESWDCFVPVGDLITDDPIPVDIPIGGAVGIRGGSLSFNDECGRPVTAVESSAIGSSFFERSNQTNTIAPSALNALHQPMAIMGLPKVVGPTMIIIGDSRLMYNGTGTIDGTDNDGNWGWLERALASKVPACSWARSSDQLGNLMNLTPPALGRWGLKRSIQRIQPTCAYLNLSINDFVNGQSAAQVQSWEVQMLAFLRGLGIFQIWTDTCDPNTTSSDGWATLANQTQSGAGAQLVLRNAALRAGGYPGSGQTYDFYIDNIGVSEAVVNGAPSGFWVPSGTTDGIHAVQSVLLAKASRATVILAQNLTVK